MKTVLLVLNQAGRILFPIFKECKKGPKFGVGQNSGEVSKNPDLYADFSPVEKLFLNST
jgi:hypothetical protein